MSERIRLLAAIATLVPALALGDEPGRALTHEPRGILRQFDAALSRLADRVAPSVVQIVVSGYGPAAADDARGVSAIIARQHAVGAGVIVDPEGYIVTNAHVVQGAEKIVVIPPAASSNWPRKRGVSSPGRYPARVIGIHHNSDLAVLKIEATGLPALPLGGADDVRQGELVFAIGTPQGLASTMTMGIVSSASRQIDLDAPMLFIQTDAPINPGNSGGPLVNADGEVVGINTFIVTGSGGSEGLGFAVPARVVRFVYEALRKRGYVRRIEIGMSAQGITPELVAGLGLPRDFGVVVSDVLSGGPADQAGLREGDVVDSVDGRTIGKLPDLTASLYLARSSQVRVRVLRGQGPVDLEVHALELDRPIEQMADAANPEKHFVRRLGIVALEVDGNVQRILHLRRSKGVIVVARMLDGSSVNSGIAPGDAIYTLDRTTIDSLEALRGALEERKRGEPMVLQIERDGHLHYLVFDSER
jgi:serine protease Do